MGSLSSLYISQSYQSLTHLGTNNALSTGTMTQLQDGIGQSLNISFDGTNISSSGNIYGANITASVINTGSFVTTSSFNSYTSSTNARLSSIETTTASLNSSVSALNTNSASVNISISNLNTATASLNLATASFSSSINQLNIFTASQSTASIVNSISNLNSFTSSANNRLNNLETTSASVNISISNLNSTTASQATSITNLNSFSQSAQVSINSLNAATSSYANSASVALVDANQQSQINSLIAATGSYLTASADITALNAFTASQLTINSAIGASTASLNTFTASAQISINNLNTFSASTLTRLTNIETTTASLNSSVTQLNASSASQQISIDNLNAATSSYITESETASFARTNIDNNFTANQTFTNITAVSASFQYVQTLYETASVIYSSGSNQFGDELSDTQTLSGSVKVQGSLTINGTPVQTSSVDISALNSFTSSQLTINSAIGASTSSLNTFTASQYVSNSFFATTGSNLFNGNQLVTNGALQVANYNETNPQFYGPVVFQGVGTASVAYDQFVNDGNFDALHIESSLNAGTIFQDYNGGGLNTWLSIPTNTGSNPAPVMTRGLNVTGGTSNLATTGSNTFKGNQTITGSLIVSNTFTASLATGFTYVGDSNNRTVLVATSSFGGGSSIDTGSFATTGSNSFVATQTITGSVNITGQYLINGVAISGSNISQFATTGSNTFNGNQTINGILTLSSSANTYFQFTSPNNATGSGAIYFGGLGPYIQTYGDESKQGLQLVAGLSGSFALSTRYAGNAGEIDLHAQYDNSTPGTAFSRIRAFSNGQINMTAEGGAITISGSSTNIQGVNFIPFSASLNTRILAITGSGGTINTGSFATTGSNTFNGSQLVKNGTIQAASYDENVAQYFGPVVFQGVGTASVAYDQFVNGGNYDALHIESNLNAGTIFQDLESNTFNLSTWLSIPTNTGNNPKPIFARGLAITGSLNMSGSVNFATGSNKQAGTAVLDGANPGTVTVSNSLVSANSIILLTKQTLTNSHMVAVSAKSGGSFTITSNGNGDADTVGWFVINNS